MLGEHGPDGAEELWIWVVESPHGATFVVRAPLGVHRFHRHFHEDYGLCVNLEGGGTFHCEGGPYSPLPGALVLTNPGDWNSGSAERPWSYVSAYPSRAMISRLAGDADGREAPRFRDPVVADSELAPAFARLLSAPPPPGEELGVEVRWLGLMTRLLAAHGSPRRPSSRRRRHEGDRLALVRDYLHAHSAATVHLRDLTDLAGWSPSHLVTSFRRRYGLPPHAYQKVLRVERARALLEGGVRPAQVAVAVGFCDQSHLHRAFRQIMNVTPGRYASAFRGAGEKNRTRPRPPGA